MNWPLFWGLAIAFGVIIGNIMLIKHSAKMKMPSLKDLADPLAKQKDLAEGTSQTTATASKDAAASKPLKTPAPQQKQNTPE